MDDRDDNELINEEVKCKIESIARNGSDFIFLIDFGGEKQWVTRNTMARKLPMALI